MATPTNVKELFAPLGKRLFNYYESRNYVKQATKSYDVELGGPMYYSGNGIISEIGKDISLFNDAEVYEEAKNYHLRIKDMIENLDYTLTERSVYVNMDMEDEIRPVTGKRKEELKKIHREELQTYLNGLEAIMKPRAGAKKVEVKNEDSISTSAETVINLPEGFKVKLLLKHFEPFLTLPQAALFLYYLQELKMIPSYSNSSLGKLAEALFARNEKNVTTNLSEIHDIKRNKAELTEFKEVLQLLIKTIDKDLKDAR